MSVLKDVAAAIGSEVSWLLRREATTQAHFGSGVETRFDSVMPMIRVVKDQTQARRLLRIEVVDEYEFMDWKSRQGGELTFDGVSVYRVHHELPACGWRIVNPFKEAV